MRRSLARDPATASVRCLLADATALPLRDDFDLILCDAPCSGTGTLARNPEIRLRLTEDDLTRQQARQRALLRSAFRLLARGGRLVYSTCSLEPEENARVVESLLAAEPEARLLPVGERLQRMLEEGSLHPEGLAMLEQSAVRGPYLQTLPGLLPCDGFFAALITREPAARG
jgi:16S rRNA (cytosine967-C5)-methyltransferase